MEIVIRLILAILFITVVVLIAKRFKTKDNGSNTDSPDPIASESTVEVNKGKLSASRMINGYAMLKIGMSEDEVVNMLGQPTGRRQNGNITTLIWRHSEWKGVARGGTKERSILVDFDENGVCGWDSENMGMHRG